jgi:putative DNA primase/helicase
MRAPACGLDSKTDPQIQAAILAWAVTGCLNWQENRLAIPERVRDYTADYRAENDPLAEWLADDCELSAEHWTATKDLRDAYERWCHAAATTPVDPKTSGWRTALKQHGCNPAPRNGKRGWSGIQINAGKLSDV